MNHKIFLSIAMSFPLFISLTGAESQEDLSLLHSCWSSSLLSGTKKETMFVHGSHSFDAPTESDNEFTPVPLAPDLQGPIRRVHLNTDAKLLALTFDLCEVLGEIAGYDGPLVDFLRANQIKATFFAGGKWMRSHSERAQQLMVDPLFELANHSEAHRNLRLLENKPLMDEILGPQKTFLYLRNTLLQNQCVQSLDPTRFIPDRMRLFRFPFGACNASSIEAVNNAGFLIIQWDVTLGDPVKSQSAETIANILLKSKPGSIVIGHANGHGYNTAEALEIAVPQLLKKGFQFVTVSELLKEGTPEIAPSCYNIRPGDTDKYDTFFKKKKSITSK